MELYGSEEENISEFDTGKQYLSLLVGLLHMELVGSKQNMAYNQTHPVNMN